jgi:hypothetical protein
MGALPPQLSHPCGSIIRMAKLYQVTIDCAQPTELARFWASAIGYDLQPPPEGHASWHAWYRSMGVPDEELAGFPDEPDRLVDPEGVGPSFWFQAVPEPKTTKNRVHLDVRASGGRSEPIEERRRKVDAEVARLVEAGASVAWKLDTDGVDHYGVVMRDPEGNEFCIT